MIQKHFIALADAIKTHNLRMRQVFANPDRMSFNTEHLYVLASFCKAQNPKFKRNVWLDYVAGRCGSLGGKIEEGKS